MHGLVHSRFASRGRAASVDEPGWQDMLPAIPASSRQACVTVDLRPGANTPAESENFFFEAAAFVLQVYNQDRYTRVVVVLTSGIFCG